MKTYGVIMAGGGGTRFWPLSTKAEPEPFLNLSRKDILVNEPLDRQHDLMDQKDIFIVTKETPAKMEKERTEARRLKLEMEQSAAKAREYRERLEAERAQVVEKAQAAARALLQEARDASALAT